MSRNYYNLYIGWGEKYEKFNPSQPPLPETEFPHNFIEKTDPNVELETAFQEAQRVAALELNSEEGEDEDYEEQFTDEED